MRVLEVKYVSTDNLIQLLSLGYTHYWSGHSFINWCIKMSAYSTIYILTLLCVPTKRNNTVGIAVQMVAFLQRKSCLGMRPNPTLLYSTRVVSLIAFLAWYNDGFLCSAALFYSAPTRILCEMFELKYLFINVTININTWMNFQL